ncbi:MarR family transcriptional regulator [Nakamurella antarctica]|uniref:MarR family transcriptional regulator n=1 Tax=Nakamurella antarctica TaxID=1902245 RepID=A0A3G8ZJ96_9ACTN|nr:MarR family transcriptional regulator [Nakamurella antarctica]AZI57268.1 MarR family transcriptional regulator [Nakamurella antarctica]
MPEIGPLAADLRFALNRINRRLRHQVAADDLTVSQLSVLAILNREGFQTAGELATKENVRPPSMTRVIGALEAAGLVMRSDNPADGRQVLVDLTSEGRGRITLEVLAREKWLAQQLSELSIDERQTLQAAVSILNTLASG